MILRIRQLKNILIKYQAYLDLSRAFQLKIEVRTALQSDIPFHNITPFFVN